MELHEMREQEDVMPVLVSTLSRAWSNELGRTYTVSSTPSEGAQTWFVQPRLSAFITKDANRVVRRFAADRFRFTPKLYRVPAQWILGTMLSSRVGLRKARPAFSVSPDVPQSSFMLVIPGSRRIRTFDLHRGVTRSLVKMGYSNQSIRNEIGVRETTSDGSPFLAISNHDDAFTWLEDELVDGYPLPRCPPWWDTKGILDSMLSTLHDWQLQNSSEAEAVAYGESLLERTKRLRDRSLERYDDLHHVAPSDSTLEALARSCKGMNDLLLSTSHGDLQGGNVHVERDERQPHLIDWEFAATRSILFDYLTLGLRVRSPQELRSRVVRYMRSGYLETTQTYVPSSSRPQREANAGMYLLEELERGLTDITDNPYRSLPLGFRSICEEIRSIDTEFEQP